VELNGQVKGQVASDYQQANKAKCAIPNNVARGREQLLSSTTEPDLKPFKSKSSPCRTPSTNTRHTEMCMARQATRQLAHCAIPIR
jgi:hypothetical protein